MGRPEVEPCDRFEWERIVRRTVMSKPLKLLAFVLATYADPDGTRIRPGTRRLMGDTGDTDERNVKRLMGKLRGDDNGNGLYLITMTARGGGRGGKGKASTYRLTIPVDLYDRCELRGPDGEPDPMRGHPDAPSNDVPSIEPPSPHTGRPGRIEGTSDTPSNRLRGHFASIEGTSRCPPTNHTHQPPKRTNQDPDPAQPQTARANRRRTRREGIS